MFIQNTPIYKIQVKQMIFYVRFPDNSSSLNYQNCPVLARKYSFLIHNRAVFRTVAVSYVRGTVLRNYNRYLVCSHVHSCRKHWKSKYSLIKCYYHYSTRADSEFGCWKCLQGNFQSVSNERPRLGSLAPWQHNGSPAFHWKHNFRILSVSWNNNTQYDKQPKSRMLTFSIL